MMARERGGDDEGKRIFSADKRYDHNVDSSVVRGFQFNYCARQYIYSTVVAHMSDKHICTYPARIRADSARNLQ